MNPIIEDRLMKMHMEEIHNDLVDISLGEQASLPYQKPNWFATRLLILGQWLIQLGRKLGGASKSRESKYQSGTYTFAQ